MTMRKSPQVARKKSPLERGGEEQEGDVEPRGVVPGGRLGRARAADELAALAAPHEEIPRLGLAAVAEGHTREAERILREDVCDRSDDGVRLWSCPNAPKGSSAAMTG